MSHEEAIDIVRDFYPNISVEDADLILWEFTSWPEFWNIPEDGNTPERCLRNQLENKINKDSSKSEIDLF